MTTPTDYPDRVRALLDAATPGEWRTINGVDDPDPAWGSFPVVVTEPSSAPDDGGDEVAIVRNRSNGDAALMAESKRIARAYLAACGEVERLSRVLRVEQGDDSAGNPPSGWSHGLDLTEDAGAIIRHVWTGPPGEVYGSPHEGWRFTRTRGLYRENQPFHETALEAMEAADRAAGGAA